MGRSWRSSGGLAEECISLLAPHSTHFRFRSQRPASSSTGSTAHIYQPLAPTVALLGHGADVILLPKMLVQPCQLTALDGHA